MRGVSEVRRRDRWGALGQDQARPAWRHARLEPGAAAGHVQSVGACALCWLTVRLVRRRAAPCRVAARVQGLEGRHAQAGASGGWPAAATGAARSAGGQARRADAARGCGEDRRGQGALPAAHRRRHARPSAAAAGQGEPHWLGWL